LETERLVLRQFTNEDIDNLVELDSDPEVMRFINSGRPTPRDEIENDVLPAFLGYYELCRIWLLGRGREIDWAEAVDESATGSVYSFQSPTARPVPGGGDS
jgi:RimJ/RimL family protein N-acetyltransferase